MKEAYFNKLETILNKNIDFVEKISAISDTVKLLVSADRCSIFIHDSISKSFWSAYIDGVSYIEIPEKVGIISDVFYADKTLIVNDVQNHNSHYNSIDTQANYITNSMIASPIKDAHGRTVGVMQVLNKLDNENKFNNIDVEHLEEAILYIKDYISRFIK
jgi:adenylate cyclase